MSVRASWVATAGRGVAGSWRRSRLGRPCGVVAMTGVRAVEVTAGGCGAVGVSSPRRAPDGGVCPAGAGLMTLLGIRHTAFTPPLPEGALTSTRKP